MESVTVPDLTRPVPAHALPERRARSHREPPRERFAPLWLRASLVLATFAALGLLYPKYYVEGRLRRVSAPNAATLAYLQLMVRAQPAAADTRILLARQALAAGNLALARQALAPWLQRALTKLPLNVALLRLRLLRAALTAQALSSARHAQLAEAYIRGIVLLAARMDAPDLMREARFAATLGQYLMAAHLYRDVIAQTRNPALRIAAFYEGIEVLRAAGRPGDALMFAQQELPLMPQTIELWRQMTRLALLADAPKVAARYARRLVGMPTP